MKNECSIVRDLLPLYLEGMLSPESAESVEEHLLQCPACAAELDALRFPGGEKPENPPEQPETALKTIKKKLRKRNGLIAVLSVLLTVAILLTVAALRPADLDYGTSELYTLAERKAAVNVILGQFYSMRGCKLYSLSYGGDEWCQKELDYCNSLADDGEVFVDCIVFQTEFRSPINGGGAWNPNSRYDWNWYLARTEFGPWKLLTWGYG